MEENESDYKAKIRAERRLVLERITTDLLAKSMAIGETGVYTFESGAQFYLVGSVEFRGSSVTFNLYGFDKEQHDKGIFNSVNFYRFYGADPAAIAKAMGEYDNLLDAVIAGTYQAKLESLTTYRVVETE